MLTRLHSSACAADLARQPSHPPLVQCSLHFETSHRPDQRGGCHLAAGKHDAVARQVVVEQAAGRLGFRTARLGRHGSRTATGILGQQHQHERARRQRTRVTCAKWHTGPGCLGTQRCRHGRRPADQRRSPSEQRPPGRSTERNLE